MPLYLEKFTNGWKVCDDKKCLSRKPMPLQKARKQRVAVALNIHERRGIPLKKLFV